MIVKQRVLPNARLGDDIGIWEGFVVYVVLYFMFKAKAIIGFMAGILVEVTRLIVVPCKRYEIRHRCRI